MPTSRPREDEELRRSLNAVCSSCDAIYDQQLGLIVAGSVRACDSGLHTSRLHTKTGDMDCNLLFGDGVITKESKA